MFLYFSPFNASSITSLDWQDSATVSELICVIGTEISIAPNVELQGKRRKQLKEGTRLFGDRVQRAVKHPIITGEKPHRLIITHSTTDNHR